MSYATLIEAPVLAEHADDAHWVVFDCRFNLADPGQGRREYGAGHIPGAHYAHLDEDLSGPVTPTSGRHPLPAVQTFAAWLGQYGVRPHSQVVTYDAQGGAIAARLWWLLRWLGHTRVAVLDGGLAAWRAAGLALQREAGPVPGGAPYPGQVQPALAVDTDALVQALANDGVRLLDARAPARFRGEQEPLDTVAGHVPGAVNHNFSDDLGEDGRWLAPSLLRERLQRDLAGAAPADTVCMCGSGVTACHTLLSLELAGLKGARLYPGSWSEWIRDPARPVATGD